MEGVSLLSVFKRFQLESAQISCQVYWEFNWCLFYISALIYRAQVSEKV